MPEHFQGASPISSPKLCRICAEKPGEWMGNKAGYASICGSCHWLRSCYGINPLDYKSLLMQQNSCCAICGSSDPKRKGSFSLDHCHETGLVRGLLCHVCNRAIGLLKDDPKILRIAAAYIERNPPMPLFRVKATSRRMGRNRIPKAVSI